MSCKLGMVPCIHSLNMCYTNIGVCQAQAERHSRYLEVLRNRSNGPPTGLRARQVGVRDYLWDEIGQGVWEPARLGRIEDQLCVLGTSQGF